MIRRPKNGPSGNAGDIAASTSPHLIDLRAVVKDYVTDAGPFRALDGVDLQVDAGEFISVVGRSGCGKSTLMNMITGIDRATAGLVAVAGQDLALMSEGRTAVWRGRTVGVIFQFFQLLPTLTVVENVMLPMDFGGLWTPRERYDRAMSLLERVGMADQARKLPSSTSGGQQQRVAVARALANDPPLLVRRRTDGQPRLGDGGCRLRALRSVRGAGPDDRDGDPRHRAGEANAPHRAHGGRPILDGSLDVERRGRRRGRYADDPVHARWHGGRQRRRSG